MMPAVHHADHDLVAATARMAWRGLVTFILCTDCRSIVSEHGGQAPAASVPSTPSTTTQEEPS
jgi:hypothetical protein